MVQKVKQMSEKAKIYKQLADAVWKAVSDAGQWGDQYGFKVTMTLESGEDITFDGGTCSETRNTYDYDDFEKEGGTW
jgi:hypothetical protein